jgi:hypothetical protein
MCHVNSFVKLFLIFLFVCSGGNPVKCQISLSTTYSETFGTTDLTTWTDNSTVPGWYGAMGGAFVFFHANITTGAPTNTGRMYSYECNSDNNQKLGSRASGGTGTIRYGVRLTNTSGSDIDFLLIEFDWYQFSLAQNGTSANTIAFHYCQAATVTSLTAGTYTAVPALDFSAPMSSGIAGTAQIEGYPCTQGGNKSYCLEVNIPAGEEIMLRWTDIDDANNDHHMGIDQVFIGIATDSTCAFILPVEVVNFNASMESTGVNVSWSTLSEKGNDYFVLERSTDAVNFYSIATIDGAINSSTTINYDYLDENVPQQNLIYYRLRQVDTNGKNHISKTISLALNQASIRFDGSHVVTQIPGSVENYHLRIYTLNGQLVYDGEHSGNLNLPWSHSGFFVAEIPETASRVKLICN